METPSTSSGPPIPVRGRGALSNPTGRFEKIHVEANLDDPESTPHSIRTLYYRDSTATIINYNDSPDVGFDASVNPYRGCEHGCVYCFARPTHEYLGFSAGIDFESRIMVKENAPELLREELSSKRWKPQPIAMSGVTDCYQPAEKRFRLTRSCLEVLLEFRNPVIIITKNFLVTRDADLFAQFAKFGGAAVFVSVTTLDASLTPRLEPRASLPEHRLSAIRQLSAAGVPVGVLVAPVIPGLTDHEISNILAAAAEAGAKFAGCVPLRLPYGVAQLFEQWVETHFPDRKEKIFGRIRSIRGGKLNDPNFGSRMQGEGPFAEQIHQMFRIAAKRAGLEGRPVLSAGSFRRSTEQLELL